MHHLHLAPLTLEKSPMPSYSTGGLAVLIGSCQWLEVAAWLSRMRPWGWSSPESLGPAPKYAPLNPFWAILATFLTQENLKNWQAGLGNVGKVHGIQQQVAGTQQLYAIKVIGTTSGLAHGTSKRLGQCQQPGVAIDPRNVQDTPVFTILQASLKPRMKGFLLLLLGVCLGYVEDWNHLTMEQNTWLFDIDMEIIPSCYHIMIIWSYHDHMILAFFLLPGSLTVCHKKDQSLAHRFWSILSILMKSASWNWKAGASYQCFFPKKLGIFWNFQNDQRISISTPGYNFPCLGLWKTFLSGSVLCTLTQRYESPHISTGPSQSHGQCPGSVRWARSQPGKNTPRAKTQLVHVVAFSEEQLIKKCGLPFQGVSSREYP